MYVYIYIILHYFTLYYIIFHIHIAETLLGGSGALEYVRSRHYKYPKGILRDMVIITL